MLTSFARSRHRGHFVAIVLIASLLAEAGCNHVHSGQQSANSRFDDEPQLIFDVGVISSELEGYRCISFVELGLEDSSIIRETRSSCACVEPRIVNYVTASGHVKPAIFLRFTPAVNDAYKDLPANDSNFTGASLAVNIDLTLESGEIVRLIVMFIHTRIE